MNNEVRKETNLEHYKGKLKEILLDDYDNPREVFRKISKRFDRQIKISPAEHPTDAILNWMAQPYKEPILDDVEKAYLRSVIKPFKDKTLYIYKTEIQNRYSSGETAPSAARRTGRHLSPNTTLGLSSVFPALPSCSAA